MENKIYKTPNKLKEQRGKMVPPPVYHHTNKDETAEKSRSQKEKK